MRELRTTARVRQSGKSEDHIRWALSTGRWTRVIHGVLGRGDAKPTRLDKARATALATDGVVHGLAAGELHNFDGVKAADPEVWVSRNANADRKGVRRTARLPTETVAIGGVP